MVENSGRLNDAMLERVLKNKELIVIPYDPISQQPGSIDVTFGNKFAIKKPWVLEIKATENQEKNTLYFTTPRNTWESLNNDMLFKGKGFYWRIRRFLYSAKHFFMVGVDDVGYFFRLPPLVLLLGFINEYIELDDYTEAILDGKSSGGRLGVTAHVTAGYAEMGFKGNMTTETINPQLTFIRLYPDMYIGQLRFLRFSEKCKKPYGQTLIGNNYQSDRTVVPSNGLKIKRE